MSFNNCAGYGDNFDAGYGGGDNAPAGGGGGFMDTSITNSPAPGAKKVSSFLIVL